MKVYPRVCGGTPIQSGVPSPPDGLSPRVRGNPDVTGHSVPDERSIPACAGEPAARPCYPAHQRVYPRVCGGTSASPRTTSGARGLSPRVRGNLKQQVTIHCQERSIPACAGEPGFRRPCGPVRGVYPRVCGGTGVAVLHGPLGQGLSPRVRGNQGQPWPARRRARSIPACAGEPNPDSACWVAPAVYPRVCGGTPWPFDNASCYLIRQGNNGDPLAAIYQIHPPSSTVSFGRFPQRQYPPHARRRRRPGHWL